MGMSWVIVITLLLVLSGGFVEKSSSQRAVKIRNSRPWAGGKTRLVGVGRALQVKPITLVNGKRVELGDLRKAQEKALGITKTRTTKPKPPPLSYDAPAKVPPLVAVAEAVPTSKTGMTVDFFTAILTVANAPYEGPNDALRQLRVLGEGCRTWSDGLIRLHQRMSDPGDMRIDPMVHEHVLAAAAYAQAMGLSLTEADAGLTALLNMTLAEITERGLQVPNTR
jgi:hypothetical protein